MDPDNAIELRDISLTYKYKYRDETEKYLLNKPHLKTIEKNVIDHLDLDVKKGEVLGIIGLNGAGKSTLLRIMARILEPDSGTVEVSGKVATILELGMGFHGDLTGRENIILKGELYGFSKKQMLSKMEDIISYSGIKEYIDNPVRTYSSGMRSRLAFSIMINVDAEIMLVDEILSTGDATFSVKASDYFKKTLKDGKTVVYVSHSPGGVESICTRAIWLKNGKIVADGPPKKVSAAYHEAVLESYDVIRDQAESGLADAQLRLSHIYRDGNEEITQNLDLYQEWLRKAADQGNNEAQVEYADLLIEEDKENNLNDALSYYQIASDQGNAVARAKLSVLLGHDALEGHHQLRILFKELAEQGNPKDIFNYANFLLKTAYSRKDKEDAFKLYVQLVNAYNHPDALMQVVLMYQRGIGTKRNRKKYVDYLKKGADLGIIDAMRELAELYLDGTYVEKDESKAFSYYMICAEMGSASCQYKVAMMYREGIGVSKDLQKSGEWFETYSTTSLVSYQIKAIELINGNDSSIVEELYCKLSQSLSPAASIATIKKYSKTNKNLEQYYSRLSKIYGKPMIIAFRHYASQKDYDLSALYQLAKKLLYLGEPSIMFKFYTLNNELRDTENEPLSKECLILSARKGFKKAIEECVEKDIDYDYV